MARVEGQKIRILYVLEALSRLSDEDHPIASGVIIDELERIGITAERKSIYRDIDVLVEYGYDIIKTHTPTNGYFLNARQFEVPEIRLLTDAVKSAGFITAKKSRELTTKLNAMLSVHQTKKHSGYSYIDMSHKCKNEEIYYTIDTLIRAIELKRQVTFIYTRRELGQDRRVINAEKTLTVNPYALIWQDDYYYLVGNNEKYDNLIHLRLDRMHKVTITKKSCRRFSEVSEYTDTFDVADYASKAFNMFSGEQSEICLRCKDTLLEQVIDRFGEDIFIYNVENKMFSFRVNAFISEGLVSWLLQFGNQIEVISPSSLAQMLIKRVEEILKLYK